MMPVIASIAETASEVVHVYGNTDWQGPPVLHLSFELFPQNWKPSKNDVGMHEVTCAVDPQIAKMLAGSVLEYCWVVSATPLWLHGLEVHVGAGT